MDEEPERSLIVADMAADTGRNKVVPVMLARPPPGAGCAA